MGKNQQGTGNGSIGGRGSVDKCLRRLIWILLNKVYCNSFCIRQTISLASLVLCSHIFGCVPSGLLLTYLLWNHLCRVSSVKFSINANNLFSLFICQVTSFLFLFFVFWVFFLIGMFFLIGPIFSLIYSIYYPFIYFVFEVPRCCLILSSSSSHAASMDLSDPLSLPVYIVHRSQEVFQAISCIGTELLYIGSSWSSYICSSVWRGPRKYIAYKFVLTSPAVSRMSGSSNLDSFPDRW